MDNTYYTKYIKYKTKYINLRKIQTGGGFFTSTTHQRPVGSRPIVNPQIPVSSRPTVNPQLSDVLDPNRDNLTLSLNLKKSYNTLLYKLKYIYYKIKYGKYYIINPSLLEDIQEYIKMHIDKIETEINILSDLYTKEKPFDTLSNKLYDRYLEKITEIIGLVSYLDRYIQDTIINLSTDDGKSIRELYDNMDTVYNEMRSELYKKTSSLSLVQQLENDYFNKIYEFVKT